MEPMDVPAQVATWVQLSDRREQLRFLQEHPDLLSDAALQALEQQVDAEHNPTLQRSLRLQRWILQRIQAANSDATAIQTAMIDAYGSLALAPFDASVPPETGNTEDCLVTYWETVLRREEAAGTTNEWLAGIHTRLFEIFDDPSHQRTPERQEAAIGHLMHALIGYPQPRFPIRWAITAINLGNVLQDRIRDDRGENQREALAYFTAATPLLDPVLFPFEWAVARLNQGVLLANTLGPERLARQETAIDCYQDAATIFTTRYPQAYGQLHLNFGALYVERLAGDHRENVELGIGHYLQAQAVITTDDPYNWALLRVNLGIAYRQRAGGHKADNLREAERYFHEALQVYTPKAYPADYRSTLNSWAAAAAELGQWDVAQRRYATARAAAEKLVETSAGRGDIDAIARDGRDSALYEAFALTQLDRTNEAVQVLETSRAHSLVQAHQRRQIARSPELGALLKAVRQAQAALYEPFNSESNVAERFETERQRKQAYYQADAALQAAVAAQYANGKPIAEHTPLALIKDAIQRGGQDHGIVYLFMTPWGGCALLAYIAQEALQVQPLSLSTLKEEAVTALITSRATDGTITGGYGIAQQAGGSAALLAHLPGNTVAAQLAALSTLDGPTNSLVQAGKRYEQETDLRTAIEELTEDQIADLWRTLDFEMLNQELRRCLPALARLGLRELSTWLERSAIKSITLIPCGDLAVFPLLAVPVGPPADDPFPERWVTFGDQRPSSYAPCVHVLLAPRESGPGPKPRQGIWALGNPIHTEPPLPFGEAEAQTIAALDGKNGTSVIKDQATVAWLKQAFQKALILDACCHGSFNAETPLDSHLTLDYGQPLTLRDLLSDTGTDLVGLRLLMLSACQTGILSLQGMADEVRSFVATMLEAGAQAAIAGLWAVDDMATYLLMVRFMYEWWPLHEQEAPAATLAQAQRWLRNVTPTDLVSWPTVAGELAHIIGTGSRAMIRGRGTRYPPTKAIAKVKETAAEWLKTQPLQHPFAEPIFWAGFQLAGW